MKRSGSVRKPIIRTNDLGRCSNKRAGPDVKRGQAANGTRYVLKGWESTCNEAFSARFSPDLRIAHLNGGYLRLRELSRILSWTLSWMETPLDHIGAGFQGAFWTSLIPERIVARRTWSRTFDPRLPQHIIMRLLEASESPHGIPINRTAAQPGGGAISAPAP